jgi:hypothetical protein
MSHRPKTPFPAETAEAPPARCDALQPQSQEGFKGSSRWARSPRPRQTSFQMMSGEQVWRLHFTGRQGGHGPTCEQCRDLRQGPGSDGQSAPPLPFQNRTTFEDGPLAGESRIGSLSRLGLGSLVEDAHACVGMWAAASKHGPADSVNLFLYTLLLRRLLLAGESSSKQHIRRGKRHL